MFQDEHWKKMNELYNELENLKEGREVIRNAIHSNFFNRTAVGSLYDKLEAVNKKIEKVRYQIKKEKKNEQR